MGSPTGPGGPETLPSVIALVAPVTGSARLAACQAVSTPAAVRAGSGLRAKNESSVRSMAICGSVAGLARFTHAASSEKRSIQYGVATNSGTPSPSRSAQPDTVDETE